MLVCAFRILLFSQTWIKGFGICLLGVSFLLIFVAYQPRWIVSCRASHAS